MLYASTRLPVPEPYLPETVAAHKAALVDITVNADDAALAGVLPHEEVAAVGEHRDALRILRNHERIAVDAAREVTVVEICAGIEQGLLPVGFLHQADKLEERVAELLVAQATGGLDVDHRYEVLLARQTLRLEVLELLLLGRARAVEMVATHLQAVAVGQLYVLFVHMVDAVAALRGLEIDIGHPGIGTDSLPEHVTLIVTKVDTMNMRAGILALNIVLRTDTERQQRQCHKYKFFHH